MSAREGVGIGEGGNGIHYDFIYRVNRSRLLVYLYSSSDLIIIPFNPLFRRIVERLVSGLHVLDVLVEGVVREGLEALQCADDDQVCV